MAGHSKFKNIMHRKGAQDQRRAKIFTKIIREVMVAVRSGLPDPKLNTRLRVAILNAKEVNMPKDKIENAIKKATSTDTKESYEEVRYEGYGPHGTAFIVEGLTDCRNRTAGEVRSAFAKHGGALGETGSVSYMFNKIGLIFYPSRIATTDQMLNTALEAGADDCQSVFDGYEIICKVDDFHAIKEHLEKKYEEAQSARITWQPTIMVTLDLEAARKILKLIDILEDNDDVQSVVGNFIIPEEVLKKMEME
ncbi:putative transcriptional regulator YebC [Alphaproteobacteria bacterium]